MYPQQICDFVVLTITQSSLIAKASYLSMQVNMKPLISQMVSAIIFTAYFYWLFGCERLTLQIWYKVVEGIDKCNNQNYNLIYVLIYFYMKKIIYMCLEMKNRFHYTVKKMIGALGSCL